MRKLITFSPQQWEYFSSRMRDDLHTSPSAFIMQLLNATARRAAGRPRTHEDDEEKESVDDIEMYKVPDKHTTSPYSYNDLVAWYQAHPEMGEIPARKNLIIHPNYKGNRA